MKTIMKQNENVVCKQKLVIPKNACQVEYDEMKYIDGGLNIGMQEAYLKKNICIAQAKGIIRTYGWKNVTADQLAKEIRGHAIVRYKASWLKGIPGLNSAIYSHVADGVDVQNKVDRFQWAWNMMWNF